MGEAVKWGHNQLLIDLAQHLEAGGKMVFRDRQIGPAGSPRPDVLSINKSYTRWSPVAYEVKVSRSDFLSDVTSGKWSQYLAAAAAVTFAVPKGLVTKAEMPEKAGLIVRHENVWRHVKRPTFEPIQNLDRDIWLSLLMSYDRFGKQAAIKPRPADFTLAAQKRHELGEKIKDFLQDDSSARYRVQCQEDRARNLVADAERRAAAIVEKAKSENPIVLESVRAVLQQYGIQLNGYFIESQMERLLRGIKEKFDTDARIVEARQHILKAAQAVGCDEPQY